jgi:hypothetical protein
MFAYLVSHSLLWGVHGAVWIDFKAESNPIQIKKSHAARFVLGDYIKRKRMILSKYIRLNLGQILDIQNATCKFFYMVKLWV